MKERIETFLQTADSPDTRDLNELKAIYEEIGNTSKKCKSDDCISKMLNAVRKYYTINFEQQEQKPKKYKLKPGLHSFVPGGPAVHHDNNTTDDEIDYYISVYPHVKNLLV